MVLQLFVILTKHGQDVQKSGPELPQGLQQSDAVGFMECRMFSRGIKLLDFLELAITRAPANLKGDRGPVLRNISMDRLHVRLSSHHASALPQAHVELWLH